MAILLPSFAEVQKDTKFPLQHLFLLHYHNPETLIENEMLVEMYNIWIHITSVFSERFYKLLPRT